MTVKTKEKRDQILKAAEELFASRRYDEITMDEIAQLAQVGKGTLYRYFSSKEALLYAILQTGHEDLVASIRAAAMKKGSFQEILTGVCRQIAVSHERRHPMFHMAFMLNRRTQNDSPEARA
ncbi:MAG: TetR/AcrR family transcriptional regulator, partial [Victivallales bacterium]|nr:TetR/AcrR family transcriptional regulator [Victivallales bacterium]